MTTSTRVFIGLGSNLGDRARNIAEAIEALADLGSSVRSSALFESAPLGGPVQGPYLNAVVVMDTDLAPRSLLDECLAIERAHGRERRERWGPRTLDLDVLLYGDRQIDEPGLTVPHPRMVERRFVIEPLLDVDPAARLPDGTALASLLPGVAAQEVRRLGDALPSRRSAVALFLVTGLGAVIVWWLVGRIL